MRLQGLRKFIYKNDKILDFGCGNGDFLFFASKSYPNCTFYGYEIANKNQKIEYNKGKLIIIKGSIKFLMNEIPKMKIITMNHTIEHLVDPEKVIKKLKNKVRTDGIIDGQTPVTDSLKKNYLKNTGRDFILQDILLFSQGMG